MGTFSPLGGWNRENATKALQALLASSKVSKSSETISDASKIINKSNNTVNESNQHSLSTKDFLNLILPKNSMDEADEIRINQKQGTALENLSYKPTEFIDVMWKNFEEVIKNDDPDEIINFFKNQEVQKRISGEENTEMLKFIQSQTPQDEVCLTYQNLLINEPQDIQSKKEFINHIADKFTQYLGLGHIDIIYEEKTLGPRITYNSNESQDKSNNGQMLGGYKRLNDTVLINDGLMTTLKGNDLLNTITHELTHAKQAANMKAYLSYMKTPKLIEKLQLQNVRCTPDFDHKNLSKNNKIMLLSNIMGFIQQSESLCEYRFYNHELEAFAVGNKVSGQATQPYKKTININ